MRLRFFYACIPAVLCLCAGLIQAEEFITRPIDGFWGMRFGTSVQECKKIMKERGAALQRTDSDTPDTTMLAFDGVKYADQPVKAVKLMFWKDQLTSATVYLSAPDAKAALKVFWAIRYHLNTQYEEFRVATDDVALAQWRETQQYPGANTIRLAFDDTTVTLDFVDGHRLQTALGAQQAQAKPAGKGP